MERLDSTLGGAASPLNAANVVCGLFLQPFELLFFPPVLLWFNTLRSCVFVTERLTASKKKKRKDNTPKLLISVFCLFFWLRPLHPEHHQHVPGLPQPLSERQVHPHVRGGRISLRVQHGIQAEWERRVLW